MIYAAGKIIYDGIGSINLKLSKKSSKWASMFGGSEQMRRAERENELLLLRLYREGHYSYTPSSIEEWKKNPSNFSVLSTQEKKGWFSNEGLKEFAPEFQNYLATKWTDKKTNPF